MDVVHSSIKSFTMTDTTIRLLVVGAPFGGPAFLDGKDLQGEFFTKSTDFGAGRLLRLPVYYDHALHPVMKREIIGYAKFSAEDIDEGLLFEIEIERSNKYAELVTELARRYRLGVSSQPIQSTVEINRKTGEIISWHLAEISLTPTPANPNALVEMYKALGLIKPSNGGNPQMPDEVTIDDQETDQDKTDPTPEKVNQKRVAEIVANAFNADEDTDDNARLVTLMAAVGTQLKSLVDAVAALDQRLTAIEAKTVDVKEIADIKGSIEDVQESLVNVSQGISAKIALELKKYAVDLAEENLLQMSQDEIRAKHLVRKPGAGQQARAQMNIPAHAPGQG